MIKTFESYKDEIWLNPNNFNPNNDVWSYYKDLQLKQRDINIRDEYVKKMKELLKPGKYIKFTGSSTGETDNQENVEGYIVKVVNVPEHNARLDITVRENGKENTYSLYVTKDVQLFDDFPVKPPKNMEKWWELNEGKSLKLKYTFTLKDIWNKVANELYKQIKPEIKFDQVKKMYVQVKPELTWDMVKKEYVKFVRDIMKPGDYIKFTYTYSGSVSGKKEGIIHAVSYGANNANIWVQLEGHTEFIRYSTFTNDGYRNYTDYQIYMDGEVKLYERIFNEHDPYGEEEW